MREGIENFLIGFLGTITVLAIVFGALMLGAWIADIHIPTSFYKVYCGITAAVAVIFGFKNIVDEYKL